MQVIRGVAAAIAIVLAAPAARADDAYPTRLVDRAPVLPDGATEVSGTVSMLEQHGIGDFSSFALGARRSFGSIEPFVSILTETEPTARIDRIASVTAGAAVPVTRTSDLRADVSSLVPFDGAQKAYRGAIAYEGRYAIVPHGFAISGAVGGTITSVRFAPPGFPPDLVQTSIAERAYARGVLELQATEHLAFWTALELSVQHHDWQLAALESATHERDAICSLGVTYATPHVDVVVQTLRRAAAFETALAYVAGVAVRF